MSTMNKLLTDIVLASGGTVRNKHNRNMLLEDWLLAVESPPVLEAPTFNGLSQLMRSNQTGVIDLDNLAGTTLEGYFDRSNNGTFYSQSVDAASTGRAFHIYSTFNGDQIVFRLGGMANTLSTLGPPKFGVHKFEFTASEVIFYLDGTEVARRNYTVGATRSPTAEFLIGARPSGVSYFEYITGKTYGHIINGVKSLDYPFDDTWANNPTARNSGVGVDGEFINLTSASWGLR